MSDPYVGEILMVAFSRVPTGWLACDGSLYAIADYDTLFNLIGTTYGGDGQTTFAVPDLRGRAPVHRGTGPGLSTYVLGQTFGLEQVTLTAQQMPSHTHPLPATTGLASSTSPVGAVPAVLTQDAGYAATGTPVAMAAGAVSSAGGNLPHANRPPSLAVTFIISAFGVFPPQA
ncbi:phage tail protein [Nocardioides rubriscoriae]|uniref:phage tail protein n=1 Tax=Nocardioides rubriscoriae TaxID=642762 RepID=UPI0011DF7112|nr:tail fiber protein [Nocardioides rubriscoriae]